MRANTAIPIWIRPVLVVAGLVVALGLALSVRQVFEPAPSFPSWRFSLNLLVFGAAAGWLIAGSRTEPRSRLLGGFYLLVASAFSQGLLHQWSTHQSTPQMNALGMFASSLPLEVFMPSLLWRFVDLFPVVNGAWPGSRLPRHLITLSDCLGVIILASNMTAAVVSVSPAASIVFSLLDRNAPFGLFWIFVFGLTLPALPYMTWRTRHADQGERRRVLLFVIGFSIGASPMLLQVLLEALFPGFRRYMDGASAQRVAGMILFPAFLSLPVTTAYSVLVDKALDVRLVIRKALQYVFARYTLVAATLAPFVAFVFYVYQRRQLTVAELMSGPAAVTALSLTGLGLVTLRLRRPLLAALDRRFFREQHDAHRVLSGLADGMRTAETPNELAERVAQELDHALHVERVAILFAGFHDEHLLVAAGPVRPLTPGSLLMQRLLQDPQPVEIDWNRLSPLLRDLPAEDRDWLVDGDFHMLVPIVSSLSRPLGLIALSEKRSELPYSSEDRMLLKAVALSVGLVLENRSGRDSGAPLRDIAREASAAAGHEASECTKCGHLAAPAGTTCPRCSGALVPSTLPLVLSDKFRVTRRVGTGAMGVVYHGIDMGLQRSVALKTLPRPDTPEVDRMRREARAMARVSHPNLAQIHGAESWRGTPILILEFMDGGSLADRLRGRAWEPREVAQLGVSLCDALTHLHGSGIIHRDIKPANIGFTGDGVPKLLDFGIAKLGLRARATALALDPARAAATDEPTQSAASLSTDHSRRGAGTPLYMSPEALDNAKPDASFDLWSLSVVLYEAVAGQHPFAHLRSPLAASRVAPDLRTLRPDCPPALVELLTSALSADRAKRPASAAELRARLSAAL